MHNDIASPDLKYTVDGLKKDKDYEFRVRAKNIAGLGEPSKPTDDIRTKPKYIGTAPEFIKKLHQQRWVHLEVK